MCCTPRRSEAAALLGVEGLTAEQAALALGPMCDMAIVTDGANGSCISALGTLHVRLRNYHRNAGCWTHSQDCPSLRSRIGVTSLLVPPLHQEMLRSYWHVHCCTCWYLDAGFESDARYENHVPMIDLRRVL